MSSPNYVSILHYHHLHRFLFQFCFSSNPSSNQISLFQTFNISDISSFTKKIFLITLIRLMNYLLEILKFVKKIFNITIRLLSLFVFGPSQKFHERFEKKYGSLHPFKFHGTYRQAINEAFQKTKILVIYVQNDLFLDTNQICNNVLCNQEIVQILNQKDFIVLGLNADGIESYELNSFLHIMKYPYLCILLVHSFDQIEKLFVFQGPRKFIVHELKLALLHSISKTNTLREKVKAKQEKNQHDRMLREEQDREYQEALQKDFQKQQEKQMEMLKETKKLGIANELRQRRMELAKKFNSRRDNQAGPETKICFRFSSGSRLETIFKSSDKVTDLFETIECAEYLQTNSEAISVPMRFKLFAPLLLRELDSKDEHTLEEIGLVPNAVILVNFISDDENGVEETGNLDVDSVSKNLQKVE